MTSHTVNRPAATNHTICLWVTTDSLLCRSIKLRRRWLFTPAGVRYIHKESDKLQRSRTKHRLAVSQPKHDDTENRCLCPADRHSSTSTVFSADQKHENTILIKWFFFLPATSNSISSVSWAVMDESLRSWLVSSRVESSVGTPFMDKILSPICRMPHLHIYTQISDHWSSPYNTVESVQKDMR